MALVEGGFRSCVSMMGRMDGPKLCCDKSSFSSTTEDVVEIVRLLGLRGGLLLLETEETEGEQATASFERRLRAVFGCGTGWLTGVAGAS